MGWKASDIVAMLYVFAQDINVGQTEMRGRHRGKLRENKFAPGKMRRSFAWTSSRNAACLGKQAAKNSEHFCAINIALLVPELINVNCVAFSINELNQREALI